MQQVTIDDTELCFLGFSSSTLPIESSKYLNTTKQYEGLPHSANKGVAYTIVILIRLKFSVNERFPWR